MEKIYNFYDQLNYSLDAREEVFWDSVYHKAFPTMISSNIVTDLEKQKLGIDRVIKLHNGKDIYIDEKKREQVYDDILLEYLSVDTKGSPGWMEQNLAIDYIAYAFMPIQTVYLFQWDLLKRAWEFYKEDWKKEYKIVYARNNTYKTYSVAVPIKTLLKSITTASIIKVLK